MAREISKTGALTIGLVMVVAVFGCGPPESSPVVASEADAAAIPVDPTAIRPFTIDVPEEVLVDLHERIAQTRFPDEVGSDWTYGTDLAYLKELLTYWRETFDWRQHERRLNEFDQYKTQIDDLDIHFIHQRSPEADALPLLITHGWPSSIAEFTKIIGPLTDPVAHGGRAEDAFHVVAPSLPGYGFSDKPSEPGFGPERIADVNAALMARLGYERYGAQGGDFGSFISRWLAYKIPIARRGSAPQLPHRRAATGGGQPYLALVSGGACADAADSGVHERAERIPGDSGHQAADAGIQPQ